jgi:hypothetical protein
LHDTDEPHLCGEYLADVMLRAAVEVESSVEE